MRKMNSRTNLLMQLPAYILLSLVFIIPFIVNIQLSFTDSKFIEQGNYVGFDNYVKLFTRNDFYHALIVLFKYTVCYTIGIFIVGFITSLLLNSVPLKRTKNLMRTMYILSYAIPDIVTALIFTWIFNYNYGVVNYILSCFGMISEPVNWLNNSATALYTIVLIEIWRQFPLHTLIIYAGFQDVPAELYEAAEIDGADSIRKFFHVTVPHIAEVLVILLMLTVIWSFRRFAMLWALNKGGPAGATETVVIQIYKNAFINNRMALACAEGVVMIIITLIIVQLYLRISSRAND